jgi:CRP-like cAMP-binding protein
MRQDHDPRPAGALPDLATTLRIAAIFSRFTDEQLQAIARHSRRVQLAAGEVLFQHGARADALFLLVTGQLKLFRVSPGGQEVIIEVLEAGATFGETRAFLDDPHYHVSCAALVDSEVVVVDRGAFLAALRESVDSCLLMLRKLSIRAEHLVDEIDHLALQSSTCRVAGYLLAQLPAGRDEVVLKVAKGVMASRLAIRAETLSRILKQLSDEGIVSVSGRSVLRVHSREKLRRLTIEDADSPPSRGHSRAHGRHS